MALWNFASATSARERKVGSMSDQSERFGGSTRASMHSRSALRTGLALAWRWHVLAVPRMDLPMVWLDMIHPTRIRDPSAWVVIRHVAVGLVRRKLPSIPHRLASRTSPSRTHAALIAAASRLPYSLPVTCTIAAFRDRGFRASTSVGLR
ncbi:uncharacterized protein PAN0_011c4286 [Moesziomyces antarcticus]|uniref:Uncharacterized protein n=2 Tax=Pseudozyma antarctica TaxID=84753 RepID=A0A5C3FTI0_PSEA2|nr:uncharacterized protein PAN0_011c4286 [Moesziomyces antarcticus]GAK66064.1 hypothetical protein PAN0_011c4286 [Moesziomyces antarcticus]SPO46841.1 uncharacterized protein PSANT_04527 [Moesziomyces antarcticus]